MRSLQKLINDRIIMLSPSDEDHDVYTVQAHTIVSYKDPKNDKLFNVEEVYYKDDCFNIRTSSKHVSVLTHDAHIPLFIVSKIERTDYEALCEGLSVQLDNYNDLEKIIDEIENDQEETLLVQKLDTVLIVTLKRDFEMF